MTALNTPRPCCRGGSWFNFPRNRRSAYRYHYPPGYADSYFGFRVVCLPPEVVPPRMALRGTSWDFISVHCRSAYRFRHWPVNASNSFGFRVVCLHPPRMVVRGGTWSVFPRICRSTDRDHCRITAGATSFLVGFRVVCLQGTPQGFTWLP